MSDQIYFSDNCQYDTNQVYKHKKENCVFYQEGGLPCENCEEQMGLGPPVCISCKVSYDNIHYTSEEGDECVKWVCPKCKREDIKDYALTISKELFEEIYGKKDE